MYDIKKLFGKNLKFYRQKKEISQEQLAEILNINSRSVSLIECGINFVTAETLYKICNALNIKPKQLFNFDIEPENQITKNELFALISRNEDKINYIYNIVKAVLE